MGAWGIGIFEDDTGCDVLDDIADADNVAGELERRLRRVVSTDEYLDYDACFDALVPAAIIDAYVNGTAYEGMEEFREQQPAVDVHDLTSLAAAAVGRILEPDTEIHELWADNEEGYPAWKTSLEALRARLAEAKSRRSSPTN